uniref:BED-type domain-containing protein n=1 Tax=Leptobrachium leishanense TaxID=445787 RepID=A0A8C5MHN7_9ANUR
MLLEDAQQLQCSDSNSEIEEGSKISLQGGGASGTQRTSTHVSPAAAAYCEVGSIDEEIGSDDDDEVTDSTWVPDRTEESKEEEAQQKRGRTSSMTNRSQSKASEVTAAQVQSAVVSRHMYRKSAVWEFFKKCAADRTVAICNLCQMRIKRGKDIPRLGTTCLRRHMTTCHASRWHNTLHRSSSSSSVSTPSICPAMSLPTTSTDRDDATVMGVPGPSSECDSIPLVEDLRNQVTLPQLLQRKKKYSPNHPQAQRLNASIAKLLALQLLPFQLVDSASFREIAECAVPQWQVSKHHFFSPKAIPALYQHMEDNVMESLGKAVSSKVHMTLDTWSIPVYPSIVPISHYTPVPTFSQYPQSRSPSTPSNSLSVPQLSPRTPVTLSLPEEEEKKKEKDKDVWEFFKKCAVERSVDICNLCQMRLKRGKETGHLGTTCLRRHMNKCHTSRPSSQCDIIPVDEDLRSQITLPQLLQRKKKYSPNHPQAQRLNASLAKLIALQLLPFQLVDSTPFREFAECAVPQWQVPKRHYFSRKAIPALYQHVEDNVIESLAKAVSSKVHVTLDTWSSKHGQGRYISFTAHWVTLIAAGRDPRRGSVLELVQPPCLQKAACMRSRWLTPCQLELGMIICDNGSNLLSTLRKGKLTHVPCLAHVLNLVVQRFLTKYPGLPELLIQARKVCSHFRRSFPASVRLAEIQREFHLPTNRLICDMPTRWNSTLAMLQHLHKQQRAINESTWLPPPQWLMIKDACTVLSPFEEEATRMVSKDSACISDTIPLVFLLEHTLQGIIDVALEAEQREEEEAFPSSQGPSLSRDHYWLATLLDPRYKGKVAELILPAQRELPSADTRASEAAGDQRNRGARADLDTFPADDPLAYWVLRLDHWPELSQYAMQLLGCPSSSVFSERTFSVAGGFVTDKRVRLSTDSVDRLTFIKINQSWISSYQSPDAEVTE